MADFKQEIHTMSLENLTVPRNKDALEENKNKKQKKRMRDYHKEQGSTERSHNGQNWKTSAVK